MLLRLIPAVLLALAAGEARAQRAATPAPTPTPALTRHGNWAEGRVASGGREACIAGTPVPGKGSLQATIARSPDGSVVLVLAVRMERETFTAPDTVRFVVDGTAFEAPGQPVGGGQPAMIVLAGTEEEARKLSDLLVAMRRGRSLRVQIGNRPTLEVSLTGASPALGAMRDCARRAGMMPG